MDISREERLAALLDGTCSEAERQELLALLNEDDDELEVFAAAAAALHEYEEGERADGTIPIGSPVSAPKVVERPRWRPPRWAGMTLAAGLAAAAVAAIVLLPRNRGAVEAVALLSDPRGPVPESVFDTSMYVTRGSSDPLTVRDRVQLGVLLADLQLAGGTDTAQARFAAGQAAQLIERTREDADRIAARFREIEDAPATRRLDPKLAKEASRVAGRKDVDLGAWLESALVAASRQDAAFFARTESREMLEGKGEAAELLQRIATEMGTVHAALLASSPRWPVVVDALREARKRLTQ